MLWDIVGRRCSLRLAVPSRSHSVVRGVRSFVNETSAFHKTCQYLPADPRVSVNRRAADLLKVRLPASTSVIEQLTEEHVGTEVVLHGYLGNRSDVSQKLSFVPLFSPDLKHAVQLVSFSKAEYGAEAGQDASAHHSLKSLNPKTAVAVRGVVQQKKKPKTPGSGWSGERNEDLEIALSSLTLLNEFPSDLSFQPETTIPPEQRHLQLRQSDKLRTALAVRAEVCRVCREYLHRDHAFLDIETPLLFKSTPEGAREFVVPTRQPGLFYALPQSPQQYKQILMASGIPRYMQIARCFRDEDLRADRQPEFTQLDLEMSFATAGDVMKVTEGLIHELWRSLSLKGSLSETFPRISYQQAMATYGSDKPDTRFDMKISRIDHAIPVDLTTKISDLTLPVVECLKFHGLDDPQATREFVSRFLDSAEGQIFQQNPDGAPGIFVFDPRAPLSGLQPFGFEAAELLEETLDLDYGDLLVIQARKAEDHSGGSTMLGNLRRALHKAAVTENIVSEPKNTWNFLWVTGFPMFTPEAKTENESPGSAKLSSTHHPFTAPASLEDLDLLASSPTKVLADHYDLVLNGVELGGGSRRIHDHRLQEYVLRNVLKVSETKMNDFAHLLEVLRAGCPPHAGIALGLDRLVAIICGAESIRDVVAFPKMGAGNDALIQSPSPITDEQLHAYHLRVVGE